MELRYVTVRELRVGADVSRDMPVSVAPVQVGRADLLLGLDWVGQRRVWISYTSEWVAVALR